MHRPDVHVVIDAEPTKIWSFCGRMNNFRIYICSVGEINDTNSKSACNDYEQVKMKNIQILRHHW